MICFLFIFPNLIIALLSYKRFKSLSVSLYLSVLNGFLCLSSGLVSLGIISRENNNLLTGFTPTAESNFLIMGCGFFTSISVLIYIFSGSFIKRGDFLHSPFFVLSPRLLPSLIYCSFFAYTALLITAFFVLDFTLLYDSGGYLTNKNPADLGLAGDYGNFLYSVLLLAGLLSPLLLYFSLKTRSWFFAFYFFLIFCSFLLYFLIASSRAAPLMISLAFFCIFLNKKKLFIVNFITLLIVLFGVYNYVLLSRNEDRQGFLHLKSRLSFFIPSGSTFLGVVSNVFMGSFSFSEALSYRPEYSLRYKVLSFSLFPSFIDGFSSIRDSNEQRINQFTPVGGFAEAYLFGPFFLIVFFAIFLLWIRLGQKTILLYPAFSIVVLFFVTYIYFRLTQYSIRTSFRFILYTIPIFLFFNRIAVTKK